MIQGGDPDSKGAPAGNRLGSGGPKYKIPAEFNDTLVHIKGALAAARQGDGVNPRKESSGSQFYIVQGSLYPVNNSSRLSFKRDKIFASTKTNPVCNRRYTCTGQGVYRFWTSNERS
ncbi:MAG: peptidylprolyl isomerase [Saprospiraceae bacterium]|nr:peptidylprolyl isomerase [Saprospiraceae bacterium]